MTCHSTTVIYKTRVKSSNCKLTTFAYHRRILFTDFFSQSPRHYARAWKSRRAVDKTPLNTPCNITVLSSIRLNGDCAYTVYQGGTTAERFAEYLKTKLLLTLSEADIIVMDNMRSHHAKAVKQLLDSSKVTYLYLPPYSPDLNPIEKMWSKLKAFLRKEKIRMASELPSAISKGFLTIRPKDCIGWFHSCNYVQ